LPDALDRAVEWLLARQHPDGWWSGELETNVTMTAEQILLFRFLGIDVAPLARKASAYILRHQREDGSWALYYDGPADLSTTIEAYVALKVLGADRQSDPMRKALNVIRTQGGVLNARVFTKIWLALFGIYPWEGVPSLPPEIVAFPTWMPFNLYDFACWARGTVAPLTIVVSRRPVRDLGVDVDEIVVEETRDKLRRVSGSGPLLWLDKFLKRYDVLPWQPGRARGIRRMTKWIVDRQEADGSWGGIQPPWVYSLIALSLEGYGLEHPVMAKGVAGFDRFTIEGEREWQFQACMSPVWDTAWAMRALAAAGVGREHAAMRSAADWLLREQIPADAPGDWRVTCGDIPCGGWAFEFDNDAYPDVDDTTIVVLALLEGSDDSIARRESIERATSWTLAMRSKNDAWAAFDRDNTRELLYRMPFADFGALIDPPTEDVTAHVLEMLAALGRNEHDPFVAAGLRYLRTTQRPDGCWFGRWGVNYVYGTWCVISALGALRSGADMVERACSWLVSAQNQDGGWGESCHSYKDPSFAGIGTSTPSQTAWAVLALQIAGQGGTQACKRGLAFLRETQETDGTWDEPQCTGTGFPGDFYINYHLYRHIFPTMALACDRLKDSQIRAQAEQEPLVPS
jgi:squalene-hopene/tetraprenyl-beta-curcumene cyclase